MFYHIAQWLERNFDIPGMGVFGYISFRGAMAIIAALIIVIAFGIKVIRMLQRHQIGEEIRNLGLEGQLQKRGTPTMGGLIILLAILVPTVLFCDLTNVYVQLMIVSTIWLGLIGFVDDYIKVFRKNKEGLNGRFKIVGQVGLGLIIGLTMWHSNDITVRRTIRTHDADKIVMTEPNGSQQVVYLTPAEKQALTTIPFIKGNEFDYGDLFPFDNESHTWGWVVYVLAAIFIVTAVSNSANLTDGLDGLAAGTSATIGVVLGLLAYFSGNIIYANYLGIMYIPFSGELFVYTCAFVGALVGFLWYNSYPAQVFMGDTGSLAVGGVIATLALLIRKEFLLPILCGVFMVESLSVMMQVAWFKYTRRKYGEGRRILLMSPLHHHYQKKGYHETKIVVRFWIMQLLLAAITLVTLKIR
ncbi:MAG: phospho-N-acetylmuramoyl-pentapeptide-transferase [Rikenellaceae bacterium]|nr:phospho-N-acetylmuramoyl-pentapeptide-transferase [Rikenellaceae bacterium]MDE7355661.1 phospho-N-acetylmuramoyl-pentapeptide-transferase [Rikenellaceae bacterium]